MASILEGQFGKPKLDASANGQTRQDVQFGSASSYADQISALQKDDILKTSTYEFLLTQDTGGLCMPDDSVDALDKFRICVETSTLRKALSSKDQKAIKQSCDEITSNRDARAIFNQLDAKEKKQVHLEYQTGSHAEIIEALVPGPETKTHWPYLESI